MEYNCIHTVTDADLVDFVSGTPLASQLEYAGQSLFQEHFYKSLSNAINVTAMVPNPPGNPFTVFRTLYTSGEAQHLIFLIGRKSDSSMKLLYTRDHLPNIAAGKSLVRVLQLSPECPDIDVLFINSSLHDTVKLSNLTYPGDILPLPESPVFNFTELNTGDYDVVYLDNSTGAELFRSFYSTPLAHALTLALIGDPASGWPFQLQDMSVWH